MARFNVEHAGSRGRGGSVSAPGHQDGSENFQKPKQGASTRPGQQDRRGLRRCPQHHRHRNPQPPRRPASIAQANQCFKSASGIHFSFTNDHAIRQSRVVTRPGTKSNKMIKTIQGKGGPGSRLQANPNQCAYQPRTDQKQTMPLPSGSPKHTNRTRTTIQVRSVGFQ